MVVSMAQPVFHGRKALAGNAAFKSENKHTNFVLLDIAPCHYHPAVSNQLFVPFLSCKLLIRRVGSSNWPGFVNGEHDSLLNMNCSGLRPCNFNYPSIFCTSSLSWSRLFMQACFLLFILSMPNPCVMSSSSAPFGQKRQATEQPLEICCRSIEW